jgi:hypothetical protein
MVIQACPLLPIRYRVLFVKEKIAAYRNAEKAEMVVFGQGY